MHIQPKLLQEMESMTEDVPVKMSVDAAKKLDIPAVTVDEKKFRCQAMCPLKVLRLSPSL